MFRRLGGGYLDSARPSNGNSGQTPIGRKEFDGCCPNLNLVLNRNRCWQRIKITMKIMIRTLPHGASCCQLSRPGLSWPAQLPTMKKPSKTPGICRIDQPSHRTHGFFVRLHRHGKIYSAFFTDLKHGGKAAALAAAQDFYRQATEIFRPVAKERPPEVVGGCAAEGAVGHPRRAAGD